MTPRHRTIPDEAFDLTLDLATRRDALFGWWRRERVRVCRPYPVRLVVRADVEAQVRWQRRRT
jgi:hypothetical protein